MTFTPLTARLLLAGLLFDVEANDQATLIAVAIVLTLVAVAASVVPARRATGVDPGEVLRADERAATVRRTKSARRTHAKARRDSAEL